MAAMPYCSSGPTARRFTLHVPISVVIRSARNEVIAYHANTVINPAS
jgi:hypothetical protein